jgi:uncharacterized ferritin-like protein (DUF455 family)
VNWDPFRVLPTGERPEPPRGLTTPEGVGDRLRAAAFAEVQAREAFFWAAGHFREADPDLRGAWVALARSEQRHLDWLLRRMEELRVDVGGRAVSDLLWHSLRACNSPREFAIYMAGAEERGRRAGERFRAELAGRDPVTSRIFGQIAEEEVAHIQLARRFFPDPAARPGPC